MLYINSLVHIRHMYNKIITNTGTNYFKLQLLNALVLRLERPTMHPPPPPHPQIPRECVQRPHLSEKSLVTSTNVGLFYVLANI
jgi:hypothetical protein